VNCLHLKDRKCDKHWCRTTGLPYGITLCYLRPDTSEGWYSIYLPWRDGRL